MSASITPEPSTKRLSFRLIRPFTVPWMTRSSSPEISPSITIELPITVCAPLRGAGTFSMPAIFVRPPRRSPREPRGVKRHGQDRSRVGEGQRPSASRAGGTCRQPGDRFRYRPGAIHLVEHLVSEPVVHHDPLVGRP